MISMILVDFCNRSIENWPSGFQAKGRGLCGRGLVGVTFVGVAIARFARYGHAHKGHALKATPTKASSHWNPTRPILDRSMDAYAKIHWNRAKTFVGVAIKSGRGNIKGSGLSPPPCTHIVSQIVLENRLSVKKIAFLCQTLLKFVNSFFMFKKKCISVLWPLMALFKAFASLRLQSKAIRA